MNKRKVYNYTRRTLAFLLAMIMTFSVVQSSTMTAFAQTGSDVVVTETESTDVIEETGTSVSNIEEVASEPSVEASVEEEVTESVSSEAAPEIEEVNSEAEETTTDVIVVEATEAVVEETVPVVDVMEDGDTYLGDESRDEENDISYLTIQMSNLEAVSDENIVSILQARADEDKTYNEVYLEYGDLWTGNSISTEIWNAAADIIEPNAAGIYSGLVVAYNAEDGTDTRWGFDFIEKTESDITLGVTLTMSETKNGGATVSFENTTFPCRRVLFNAYVNSDEMIAKYETAFGNCASNIKVYNASDELVETVEAYYLYYEYNRNIRILDITQLTADEQYTFIPVGYIGEYDYENNSLYLHPGNVDQTSFTAEQITSMLSNYDKESFSEITIVYCTDTMGGTVDDAVINAALPYLKEPSEDRASSVCVVFQHTTTGEEFSWNLVNPGTQTADQTLSASFTVSGNNASICVGSQSLVAEGVNINISRSNEQDADGVAELKTLFGEEMTRLSIGDVDTHAEFNFDEYSAWIYIDDVSKLTADTTYTLDRYVYKGRIDTWDDGRKELVISYQDAEKETAFSEEELLAILANYEDYKVYNEDDNLYSVYIEQPLGESDTIYKSVADAAADLLPNGGDVKFAFRDQTTGTSTEWILEGISADVDQYSDQVVKAALTVTSNNLLVFNRDEFDFNVGENGAVCIGYSIDTNEDTVLTEDILGTLGDEEGYRGIMTYKPGVGGELIYNNEEHSLWFWLHGIESLIAQKDYPIVNSFYHGNVNEYYDEESGITVQSLSISAFDIEKETFDVATFNKIVDYWKKANRYFANITIEQSFTNNNVINKDIFNKAKELLYDPTEQDITFVFCNCQMAEQDENGEEIQPFIQSDMNWHFRGITGNASKDMNANVSAVYKGGGVSVVLNSNTYPAKDIDVQFWMNEDADMVQNVLVPAFGNAQQESSLVVLEKAATLKSTEFAHYDYNSDENMVNFYLSNVEDWMPGIDNRIVEVYYRQEAAIGEQANVMLFTYNPNNPDDPQKEVPTGNMKFTLLTPDLATLGYRVNDKGTVIDYIIPNVPWKTVYTLCTYPTASGEPGVEVLAFPTTVEVSGLSFAKDNVTVEWDSNNEDEQGGFLDVTLAPRAAQNHFNPQEFTWTVSGNSIRLVENDYYTWSEEEQTDVLSGTRPNGEFVVTGYGSTTVTVAYGDYVSTCTVNVIEPVQVPDINSIFAIPAIDTKLSDLGNLDELIRARCSEDNKNYTGTFEWKDDSISLAPYANMERAEFGAIYRETDGREVALTVSVDMLRINELRLCAAEVYEYLDGENYTPAQTVKGLAVYDLNGSTVLKGEDLVMGYQVGINREQFDENGLTDEFATFARYITEGKLVFRWSSKETLNEVPSDTEDGALYNNGQIQKPRSYTATSKGKKTFTVEAVNLLTNQVIFKNSATVIVNENPLFSFEEDVFTFTDTVDPENDMKGTYTIAVSADNYTAAKKLTIKSADTSVLKLGSIKVNPADKTESGKVEITVPYEFKKYGKTVLKVTAADEVKTSEAFTVERVDYAPKIPNTNYTIDKSWMYVSDETAVCRASDSINIASRSDITLKGEAAIKEEAYQNIFKLVSIGDGCYILQVEKENLDGLKNKTYTLTLEIPYTINTDETGEVKYSEQTIKVKVTQSKIKVTAKQTQKINEFYTLGSEESNGVITVKSPYLLHECSLNDDSVFDLDVKMTNGYNEVTYALVLKDTYQNIEKLTDAQKKITLNYTLVNGSVEHNGSVNLTLKTENKKPALVLTKTSDTLYPSIGLDGNGFVVMDKATGELMDLTENVSVVLDKRKNITQAITNESDPEVAPYEFVKVGKNNYFIYTKDNVLNYWLYDSANAVKATDKFIIRVQKDNWNGYVDVTYSAKVDLNTPNLKLDSKTLTINANEEVYRYQIADTHINATGYNGTWFDEIWISGVKDADKIVLENYLSFTWNQDESKIRITIDDQGTLDEETGIDTRLKPGNYKFKVWTMLNGHKLSTDLTLKVVDKAPAKLVTVAKKGSIDVLRRASTQITMDPKLSNLSGEIVNFRLEGPDAELFNYYYDWDTGNCVVQAKDWTNYSTKINYNVTPVYGLDAENGYYEVDGKAQKIKVTQGKPKVSIWTNADTLYGDKSNELYFDFDAMLKNENIYVSDVKLLNYTNDLDWEWDWEADMGILSLNDNTPKDITKASGKYTLKFAVTYTDAAGNEKAAQVSYKMNIVR